MMIEFSQLSIVHLCFLGQRGVEKMFALECEQVMSLVFGEVGDGLSHLNYNRASLYNLR